MQPLLAKIRALTAELKGAPVGHEFYGNQYTDAAIAFNEAWIALAPGIYRNGDWGISRRNDGWHVYMGVTEGDLITPPRFKCETFPSLDAARRAVNQFADTQRRAMDKKGAPVGHEFYGNQYTDVKINSPEFKAWFGNSKVVGKDGKPLVVYHGTPADFAEFRAGNSGPALWFGPDPDNLLAAHHLYEGHRLGRWAAGTNIMPVYLRAERPLVIDSTTRPLYRELYGNEFPQVVTPAIVAELRKDFDSVIDYGFDPKFESIKEILVFDPSQVKSAISNSSFDPKNPDITKAAPDGHPFYGNQYIDGEVTEDVAAKLVELRKLSKNQLDELDPYDDKTGATYKAVVLLDAERKLPKADGGWRNLPSDSRLGYMAHALVNVGGKPYLASKYDDPDDISGAEDDEGNPAKYVWNFSTPADQLYARSENSFTGNFQNKEDAVAEFREHLAKKREAKSATKSRNPAAPAILKARAFNRERVRSTKLALRSAQETPLQRAIAAEISRVGVQAAKAARTNRLQKELGNLREEHTDKVRGILHKAHDASARAAWDNQFLLLRGRLGKARMQSFLDRTLDFLDEQSGEKIVGISDTTLGGIQNALTYGEENEFSLDEISDFITEITGGIIGGARAATIARTEVGFATSTAEQNAIEDSGVPCARFWMSTEDGVTRPSHLAADGQRRGMQEPFLVGGEYLDYPNDPNGSAGNVINCRCVVDYQPV